MHDPDALRGVRILNLMLGAGRGGLETMARRYHDALSAAGAVVTSVGRPDGWFASSFPDGSEFTPFASLFPGEPLAAAGFGRRAAASDLVVAHGNRAIALATSRAGRRSTPVAAVVHNFRFKPTVARADLAVAVSPAVREALSASHPRLNIVLVENFGPLSPGAVKPTLAEPPLVVGLGRLHVNKGFDRLVEAAALLAQRGRAVLVAIGGEGPERSGLEALASRLGVPVEFRGWVEPAEFLVEADLFVLSSRVEPFGLVVAEAMTAGVPVVSTDIDGPRDILQGGRFGQLCRPDDAGALADAIQAALADPAALRAKAEAAMAGALELYDMEAGRVRLVAALAPLLANAR